MIESKPSRETDEFAGQVRGMFDRIAGVYDSMNSTMTAGMDRRWRQRAAASTGLTAGGRALDVACGTGDLSLELQGMVGPGGYVVGSDFSERMLELARAKGCTRAMRYGAPTFEWGDALQLSYDDASFDAVTVGFGLRNFADLDRGIAEMARVLRPGGTLVVLEITRPRRAPLSSFFSLWFDRVVPLLGRLTGEGEAYSYLPESVRQFPLPAQLAARLDAAGLERIRWTILAGGIIAIHSGVKRAG
jgi:demethylmenaquinone methyltransferase/2-methoxy-6-polyprenyl-1,4-benzoquinol methylase